MEKRSFQKLIMYVSIVLIFIAAVVLVFCAREVKNTTEQVNDTIKSNLDYASVSCENILTDAVNVLNVNYFTTQYIHEKNEDNAMLKEYFVEQTEYLKDRLGLSYLGIYGYIDGELMLSGQWMPPADYHVEDRLWYREIIANGTDLTFVTPYIDMKTGKQVLTIGRTMENGTDMVGVDLDIKNLSEMLQMLQNDIGDLYIVNSSGIIEAGTDFDMVGSSLTDYYGKNEKTQSYEDKINEELEQNSDIVSYKTASSWISVKPIMNDWYVVSIINKDSINWLIARNAIPSAVNLITVLVVFFMLYLNLFRRAGHGLSFLMHPCGARTPSFFFVREKERWGRKKKPYATFPAGGGPLPASRRALCRCGLRPLTRKIETFSARVATGTPASCRGSPFCFLPAPPRACVTTRTEKLGDQLPRGSAA